MDTDSDNQTPNIFSDEEIENISGFTDILQKIRLRLVAEGVSIDDERKRFLQKVKN
ncbi:MAG: hypothetical protein V4665_01555 [Patescibacteria group bacterium]